MLDVTFELGCDGSRCDYKNGIIYVALNAEKEDIDHEFGHLLEDYIEIIQSLNL